jgi:hypothetical protein
MGKDSFDASVGLAFSLAVFERYRKNGLLQATLHHVPHISGRCQGYVQLVEGKVTFCYIEDKRGQRHPIDKQTLIDVDTKHGPFEWLLQPLPVPPSSMPPVDVPVDNRTEQYVSIPKSIALLELDQLMGWSSTQKLMLAAVYEAIDGWRTIEEIKQMVPLPPYIIDEALRTLLALKVITIVHQR